MKSLAHHIRRYGTTSVSVDVFDPLLLRTIGNERERYRRIAVRWQPFLEEHGMCMSPLHVALWRQWIVSVLQEAAADQNKEAFLDEIVEALVRRLSIVCGNMLSPDAIKLLSRKLVYEELLEEKTMLRLNVSLVNVLREFKKNGGRIYFISDMYLRGEHVSHLLGHFGIMDIFHGGVTSSDVGGGKGTGTPFQMLLRRHLFPMVDHHKHVHVGDHAVVDIATPRSLGIPTLQAQSTFVWWVRLWGQIRFRLPNAWTMFFLCRNTRRKFRRFVQMRSSLLPDPMHTLWSAGARLATPLAYFFVYTAEYARALRCRPVFCSGEMHQCMKYYRVWGGSEEAVGWRFLRRVHAIRALFHRIITTQEHSFHSTMLRLAIADTETPSRLLETLGVPEERARLADFALRQSFHSPESLDNQMRSVPWMEHFFRYVTDDPDCKRVLWEADTSLLAALHTLHQDGKGEILLVDVGWNGTIQGFFEQYIRLHGYRDVVRGLYFGVTGNLMEFGHRAKMRGVLVQNGFRHPHAAGLFVKALWEYILAPPAQEDFKHRMIAQGVDAGMAFLHKEHLPPHLFFRALFPDTLQLLEQPKRAEIDLLGRIVFDEGLQKKDSFPMADLSMPLHRVWRRFLRHPRRYWRTVVVKQQWRHAFLRWYRLYPISWGLRIRSRFAPWQPLRSPFR
ncbi:MAG: Haloacid dehalogenase protein [Candidatus Peregrinibacteria bacterium Greene1014_49]|nr:MAG: Haloacid dehalogenase protein [Candidatus Peregrinibacteria bacterium Greene1014_49]